MDKELSSNIFRQSESAEHFIVEGEFALLAKRLPQALKAFEAAQELSPNSPELYYRAGLSLFEYGSEKGCEDILLIANKKFKLSTSHDPHFAEAYHAWGNSLVLLGERREEHHYFVEGKQCYEKALALMGSEDQAEIYWDYGVAWYHLGNHSGEAVDFQQAMQSFEKAQTLDPLLSAEFWIDYGTAALQAAEKIRDLRPISKAVHCFKQAISQEDQSYDGWASLAEALEALYHQSHDE